MKYDQIDALLNQMLQVSTEAQAQEIAQTAGMQMQNVQNLFIQRHGMMIRYINNQKPDVVQLHMHDFYEILFICQGQDIPYLVNGTRYLLHEGDILFIPPNCSHRPLLQEGMLNTYERYILSIDPVFLESFCNQFSELALVLKECAKANYLLCSNHTTSIELRRWFDLLWHETELKYFGWQGIAAAGAIQLIALISRNIYYNDIVVAQSTTDHLFDNALQYIKLHLTEKLTLKSLANELHISQSAVSKLFQKHLGISFYHYVIQRRLVNAQILIFKDTPMCEICERCGFSDYSSFYRLFKKEFGLSPKEFRAQKREDNI